MTGLRAGSGNAILNTLATAGYRARIAGTINYGLNAAVRDARTDASPPPPWWQGLDEEDFAVIREDHAE